MTSSLGLELKLYLEPGEDNDDPTADDPGKVSHSRLELIVWLLQRMWLALERNLDCFNRLKTLEKPSIFNHQPKRFIRGSSPTRRP